MTEIGPKVSPSSAGVAPRTRRMVIAGAALLLVIHSCAVLSSIPPQVVFSHQPLRGTSYDRHYGQVIRVATALENTGKTWVYDVQLLAGQPEGVAGDLDSKAWELWTFALCRLGVHPSTAFNSFVLLIMLLGPMMVGVAAACFGLTPAVALLATALSVLLWFFDSYLHWLWFSGMISWAGASAVSIVVLGLFERWTESPRVLTAAMCSVTLGIAVLLHAAAIVIVLPPLLILYVRQFKQLDRFDRWVPAAMLLVAAAVNSYWLGTLLEHRVFIAASASSPLSGVRTLLCDAVNLRCPDSSSGGLGTRSGLRLACGLLAAAWMRSHRGLRRERGAVLHWGVAWGYGFAFFGGLIPGFASSDPYQLLAPALLMTTIPAARFLSELARSHQLHDLAAPVRWLLLVLSVVMARETFSAEILYFLPSLTPEPAVYPDGAKSPLSQFGYIWAEDLPSSLFFGVPHDEMAVDEVAHWMRRHARQGARVLVQNAVLGERLAWRDHFEVIGGESRRWLTYVDANYFSSVRSVPYARNSLSYYLNAYAIEYVVGNLPAFRDASSLKQIARVSGQTIYQHEIVGNRILHGGGTLTARTNAIEIRDSHPEEPLVISYHWHPALRCKPHCQVTRLSVEGDRVGFLGVPSPHPRDLVLWNSYEFE